MKIETVNDEAAIRRLAALYARAVDRNEPEVIAALFTPDAVIEGPGFTLRGLEQIRGVLPAMLRKMYCLTCHVIHNQTITFSGDNAEGETYCTANHLTDRGGGKVTNLIWALRYQDQMKRDAGRWRFARRTLILDWTETRNVAVAKN